MKNILEVKNLSFHYDEYNIKTGLTQIGSRGIDDISFSVPEGSFVTLCGSTGSGKSTLLKLIKRDIITSGKQIGDIFFDGSKISELDAATLSSDIGFLFQNPEDQIVTDKVWHEIAFGLENLGMSQSETETRLAEALAFFNLENISRNDTASLSGGQKQLVSLASVLAMYPRLLLLDEPTSQLDPEAAERYISTIKKLQSALGITVIIAEHNLDRLLPISDLMMVMDNGKLLCCDTVDNALSRFAKNTDDNMRFDIPLPARYGIYAADKLPLDINQGRLLLKKRIEAKQVKASAFTSSNNSPDKKENTADLNAKLPYLMTAKNLSFKYPALASDIIHDLSATFIRGKIYSILGCNASGKSTLLNILAGNLKPQLGHISPKLGKIKIAYMPQDTDNIFIADTVEKELLEVSLSPENYPEYIGQLDKTRNPQDLSGGEKQLLALAKVSALAPELLLLDEPTKGTDSLSRTKMATVLRELATNGTTVIMACHDMNFAAECSDLCAILSMGRLSEFKHSNEFFTQNMLYTTPAHNMTAGIIENIYLEEDIFKL